MMQRELRPQAPVIPSALSAEQDAKTWTEAHDYRTMTDGAKIKWTVKIQSEQQSNLEDDKGLIWVSRIILETQVSPKELVDTGTLDDVKDRRLIAHMGLHLMSMRMKSRQIQGDEESKVNDQIKAHLPKLKEWLADRPFHEMKRDFVNKWVDQLASFSFEKPPIRWELDFLELNKPTTNNDEDGLSDD